MAMTILVTLKVADRVRGFLGSCASEIAPGVYTAPRMTKAVRERVWAVLEDWIDPWDDAAVVMTWRDPAAPGGQAVKTLGTPAKSLHEHYGIFLARRELGAAAHRSLKNEPKPGR